MAYDEYLMESFPGGEYAKNEARREAVSSGGGLEGGPFSTYYDLMWGDDQHQQAAFGYLDVGMPSLSVARSVPRGDWPQDPPAPREPRSSDREPTRTGEAYPNTRPGVLPKSQPPAVLYPVPSSLTQQTNLGATYMVAPVRDTRPRAGAGYFLAAGLGGAATGPYSVAGPGGAVAPGLREAWGDAPLEKPQSRLMRATGFDASWGTPPPLGGDGVKLEWNSGRRIYEPVSWGRTPRGQVGAWWKPIEAWEKLVRDGIFYQAYKDKDALPGEGEWLYRYVHVTTPYPDVLAPYTVLKHLDPTWSPTRPDTKAEEASRRARWEAAKIEGERVKGTVGQVQQYATAERVYAAADYAWLERRHLPPECPYPMPLMPVPQADYASGYWLDPNYVPSIPLPPPYDAIPWQCNVPSGRTTGR